MNDIFIFYKAILKVIKYFFPAITVFVVGLGIIAHDEGRDKHKKRPFRRPSDKVK
ncbi:hypothetical protein [Tepidimicrobium xylanilyticum]